LTAAIPNSIDYPGAAKRGPSYHLPVEVRFCDWLLILEGLLRTKYVPLAHEFLSQCSASNGINGRACAAESAAYSILRHDMVTFSRKPSKIVLWDATLIRKKIDGAIPFARGKPRGTAPN
jgi:hypothetical protein